MNKTLIERHLNGSQIATNELCNEIYKATKKFVKYNAFKFQYKTDDLDDLTQEVSIKIFKNIHLFDYKFAFETWVGTIVKNAVIDRLRKRKQKAKTVSFNEWEDLDGDFCEIIPIDHSSDINVIMEREERKKFVYMLLNIGTLNENEYVVAELRYINGLSYRDIAIQVGADISSVKSRIHSAKMKFVEYVQQKNIHKY